MSRHGVGRGKCGFRDCRGAKCGSNRSLSNASKSFDSVKNFQASKDEFGQMARKQRRLERIEHRDNFQSMIEKSKGRDANFDAQITEEDTPLSTLLENQMRKIAENREKREESSKEDMRKATNIAVIVTGVFLIAIGFSAPPVFSVLFVFYLAWGRKE